MVRSLTSYRSRGSSYDFALTAYRNGDASACVAELVDAVDAASKALLGRAYLRLGEASQTTALLAEIDLSLPKAEAGELFLVRATASIALERWEDAESSLVEARARVFSVGCPRLEAQVYYTSALLKWTNYEHAEALRLIGSVLSVREGAVSFLPSAGAGSPIPLAYWRARAYELWSANAALDERFLDKADLYAKAFDEFEVGSVEDRLVEAALLLNASVLVRDVEAPALAHRVARRAETFPWNEATRQFEARVFSALGTRSALAGDHLAALRYFRRSADRAPSLASRMLAILDRSRLMSEFGETLSATEERDHALRLAAQIDWEAADSTDRATLSSLAELLTDIDAPRARMLFDRYRAIKTPVSRLELGVQNRLHYADECFVEGRLFRAEGEPGRAVLLLVEAFEIWSHVGYERMRAMAAFELSELTGESRFARIAKRMAARYPSSPLARRMRARTL